MALALHILRLLACERQTTTGLVGTNVLQEITGPVNDIVTDVETLLEDYIGHDDLRVRLRTISENAARIRQDIKDITAARPAVWGVRSPKGGKQDEFLAGRRVLLADDEDIIRETVRDVLTGYGCIVHTASDGATALDLIAREPFDLVLSDIKMPIKNGYEVFAAAKQANPKTPVILTTGFGYDPNHTIIRARREGLAAVLFKPFKVDQLLGEIRSAPEIRCVLNSVFAWAPTGGLPASVRRDQLETGCRWRKGATGRQAASGTLSPVAPACSRLSPAVAAFGFRTRLVPLPPGRKLLEGHVAIVLCGSAFA